MQTSGSGSVIGSRTAAPSLRSYSDHERMPPAVTIPSEAVTHNRDERVESVVCQSISGDGPVSSIAQGAGIPGLTDEVANSDHGPNVGDQSYTPRPGSIPHVASIADEGKDELNHVGNSSSAVVERYAESLGPFWKFKMVYESLTYVLFFACHSKMTHSSSIWRALQGDVMYFSWLSQSFPLAAIQLIQSESPIAGVCVFMSLYGVITTLRDKIEEVHAKLIDETKDFGKRQRKAQKEPETVMKSQNGTSSAPCQDVRFASEIPGKQERPQQQPDNEVAGKECELQLPRL